MLRKLLYWYRTLPGWSEQAKAACWAQEAQVGRLGGAGCEDAVSLRGSTMNHQYLWSPVMGREPGGQNWGRDKGLVFTACYFVPLDVCSRCNCYLYNSSQNVVQGRAPKPT